MTKQEFIKKYQHLDWNHYEYISATAKTGNKGTWRGVLSIFNSFIHIIYKDDEPPCIIDFEEIENNEWIFNE